MPGTLQRRRQLPGRHGIRSSIVAVLMALVSASSNTCSSTGDDDGLQQQHYSLTGVKGALVSGNGLTFCTQCVDVLREGSVVPAWESYHNPDVFRVYGDIVYAVPNTALDDLYNGHQVDGRLVLVDRGDVPIADKARRVQEAGGTGMVVVDSGECGAAFACGVLGSPRQNGFLEQDEWVKWRDMHIPVVLVLQPDGDRIKAAMDLVQMDMPDLGLQYVLRE
ncbi:hypothetical protein, variant [Aphanomyces astaci]|uniref:PA domain-containing protein n=1 Tax=Aphanomyces astaci TaxID=112090 RepID=W4FVC1_APHAT|nr:hypothetical protein, variant [Aphanomyces astaci]ETV70563.1 hypothetical protein, variant [Aphanomyces astaci]|eukprot:XP_009839946.1 hypothetical protein, variant [Aphanomyces astaci]